MSLLNTDDINNPYLLQKLETNFPYMSELIEGIKYNEFGKQPLIKMDKPLMEILEVDKNG